VKRAIWALVIAVPLVALLAYGFGRDPSAIASPLLNKPAPDFTLRTLDGKSLALARFRGRPVVLNFWASWCAACKIEHPYLVQAWQTHSPNVGFIGVVYEDSASNARAFMSEYGGGWPDVLDPGQRTAIDYGVYGIPETFFIDRGGIIRYKQIGPVTRQLLDQEISALLQSKL
jgi:cytochrome c biogenesis protein CcmG/thiol:disulfide interchange protein DsbE